MKYIKTIFASLVLLAAVNTAAAQDEGWTGGLSLRGDVINLSRAAGIMPAEISIINGYNLDGYASVIVPVELTFMSVPNDIPDWGNNFMNASIGLGLTYDIWRSGYYGTLSVSALAGRTLFGKKWHHTYADAGIYWAFGQTRSRFTLGTGVRYYYPVASEYDSFLKMYISIGVRIN